jgi:type I restriction enzyme R subunit
MTTRLARESTHFLPFNRGNGTGKGNPLPLMGPTRTGPSTSGSTSGNGDSLLDLLGAFLHFEKPNKDDKSTGKKTVKETLIFPGSVKKFVSGLKGT